MAKIAGPVRLNGKQSKKQVSITTGHVNPKSTIDHISIKQEAVKQSDDEDYNAMDFQCRVAAEEEHGRRVRGQMKRDNRDILYDKSNVEAGDASCAKRHRAAGITAMGTEEVVQEGTEIIDNLEDTRGYTTMEWVSMLEPRTEIANRFKNYLLTSTNSRGQFVYKDRIRCMCKLHQSSFNLEFNVLARQERVLVHFLLEVPFQMLQIFDEAAKEIVLHMFPSYERITSEIHVRISDLPLIDELSTFRDSLHLNQLVRTEGVITATTEVLPQMRVVQYDCNRCGMVTFVQYQTEVVDDAEDEKPRPCPKCQNNGPFMLNIERMVYRNYQKVIIEESPGRIPAGRIPRSKECVLLADLCDRFKPGDEVDLTGVYTNNYDRALNTEQDVPIFDTVIVANYIVVKDSGVESGQRTRDNSDNVAGDASRSKRLRATEKAAMGTEEVVQEGIESIKNLEDTKGYSAEEWVSMLGPRTEIANRFKKYLLTYTNSKGQFVYKDRIRCMCELQRASFYVEFNELQQREQVLTYFLVLVPFQMLQIFDEAAKEIVLQICPSYERVTSEIHVRISDLPLDGKFGTFPNSLHLNQFVRIVGVVTAITEVLPQMSVVQYDCNRCGILVTFVQYQTGVVDDDEDEKPRPCPKCQSNGPFMLNMKRTVHRNYQKMTIQESPGRIPAGRIPRSKECVLLADLCDRFKTGDEVDLTGVYTNNHDGALNTEQGFPIFDTVIVANYIVMKDSGVESSRQTRDVTSSPDSITESQNVEDIPSARDGSLSDRESLNSPLRFSDERRTDSSTPAVQGSGYSHDRIVENEYKARFERYAKTEKREAELHSMKIEERKWMVLAAKEIYLKAKSGRQAAEEQLCWNQLKRKSAELELITNMSRK